VLKLALIVSLGALVGCVSKAREAIAPQPEGVGTLSCREVVEQCDSQCGDPICLNRCTGEGTQEAQGQHAALLDCGQRNGCTDQTCMEQSCPTEISACMGPEPGTPVEDATPAPEGQAPGQSPPS
jgi:hypothetical protein